jgi:hypothetical protein
MEKKITNFAFALLAFCLTFVGCSKDDSTDGPIDIHGGEVSQAQVATVVLTGSNMNQNVYNATIGGTPIKVVRSGEDSITFYTPIDLAPGNYDVVIPDLDATVTVEVLPTQLIESPDETIADFLAVIDNYSQGLGDTPQAVSVKNAITSFNTFYASASAEQKNAFAVLYKANKAQFDNFFLNIDGNRSIVGDYFGEKFAQNTSAVWKIALGTALVVTAPVLVTGAVATIAVGVTGVLIAKAGCENAYSINEELVDDVYKTLSMKVGGWFGNNDRSSQSFQGVAVMDNISQQMTFDLIERHITSADANSTAPLAVQYFEDYTRYNQIAGSTNTLIDNLGNANPAISYEDVSAEQLPSSSPEVNTPVSSGMFENMTFSVDNADLSIQQASVSAEGQLTLQIKIVGNPATLPIQTTLKYAYSDGLSEFTGSLPLKVSPSVIGTWKLVSFEDGKALGEYVPYSWAESCQSLVLAAYTMESETFTIGATSYSSVSVETTKIFNLTWSGCSVLTNGPDTVNTYTDTETGTYVLDGDSFTVTPNGGEVVTVSFQWINKNKVRINDSVYVRQ